MKSTRWMFRAIGGTASLILVGCWTPAPYGYSTYPGYYAPPNQGYMAPPGAVVSPGVPYPAPQLGPPGNPSGSWTPAPAIGPTPGPTPAPSPVVPLPGNPQSFNGGPATFSDPRLGSTRQSDIPVPEPIDAGPRVAPRPAMGPAPTNQNSSPFGSEGKESFEQGTQMQIPKRDEAAPQSVAADTPDTFVNPLDQGDKPDSGVVAVAAKTVDAKTRAESPNRYDYDRTSYSYLRGIVDFNSRHNTWNIIYNPKPDRSDKYGGSFQLVDNRKLNGLHDGDVVFIQGRVSPHEVDERGKPKYEVVEEVARITRRATQSVGN